MPYLCRDFAVIFAIFTKVCRVFLNNFLPWFSTVYSPNSERCDGYDRTWSKKLIGNNGHWFGRFFSASKALLQRDTVVLYAVTDIGWKKNPNSITSIWICCTTCLYTTFTTNPQQIEGMEFALKAAALKYSINPPWQIFNCTRVKRLHSLAWRIYRRDKEFGRIILSNNFTTMD